ncbi:hypothetical protein D478_20079 [Brevibacillus agri BAB-2500]|nr:hypothetical protein D478_20079 [Brevibacillus agri BAB-2500]
MQDQNKWTINDAPTNPEDNKPSPTQGRGSRHKLQKTTDKTNAIAAIFPATIVQAAPAEISPISIVLNTEKIRGRIRREDQTI